MKPMASRTITIGPLTPDKNSSTDDVKDGQQIVVVPRVVCDGGKLSVRGITIAIYLFLAIYVVSLHSVFPIDPQLTFLEIFGISPVWKSVISTAQFLIIILALKGAVARSSSILYVPMTYQICLFYVQTIFSFFCLICILCNRHEWYEKLMENQSGPESSFMKINNDRMQNESVFVLLTSISASINFYLYLILKGLYTSFQDKTSAPKKETRNTKMSRTVHITYNV